MSTRLMAERGQWLATPLIAFASFLSVFSLSAVLELGDWLRTVAGLLAVVVVAIIVTRALSRSRALPTTVGAVVAVMTLILAFAKDTAGRPYSAPTPSGFTDLARVLQSGIDHATSTPVPVDPAPAFVALVTTAIVVLFLVAEHLAVSWRAAATTGFVLLAPWLPAMVLQHSVPTTALLLTLGAWIATMALTRRTSSSERAPSVGAALSVTAATMLAVVLVAPTAIGGNGWGAFPRVDTPDTFDPATRLNLDLDLRASLTTNSQSTVMTYTVNGSRPDSFRLYALTDFDGTSWIRNEPPRTDRLATTGVLWPVEVSNWGNRTHQRINMRIHTLTERSLPLPVAPRTVSVSGDWFYSAELDEVMSAGTTTTGLTFQVVTDLFYHDARTLQAAQDAVDDGRGDPTDPRYLDIAPSIDVDRIGGMSRAITAGATTRYEQAIALQQYLRNPVEFTYDVSVSPYGADSISTFLDDRTGYCVQFASTMVIMARSLGIPARLAVGFLGGRADGEGGYEIRGADAHAWPELYFPDRGWVRFEPTPAIQTGAPPRWADPLADQVPVDHDAPDPGLQPAPVVPDNPVDLETPPGAGIGGTLRSQWWLILAAGVIAGSLLWWMWGHGRVGLRRAQDGVEGAWDSLRQRLGADMAWSVTLTPHETAVHVRSRMSLFGYGLSDEASNALKRLSDAVSDHRYSPTGTELETTALMACVDAIMAEVDQARAAEATNRPVRGGGRTVPLRGA